MKTLVIMGCIIWLSMATTGVVLLNHYQSTPGVEISDYPKEFPSESRLIPPPLRPTLIFFAHPKCPCTRASLRELARLMPETAGKMDVYVVLLEPENVPADWTETDLRTNADSIPGVHTVIDRGERESLIFHAQTSGTTLLYDGDGKLKFAGGITAARGHEGDNVGRRAISEIVLAGGGIDSFNTPVFGCPLRAKDCAGQLMETAK